MEEEARTAACNVANAFCDALNYLGDVSYAILPHDLAHDLGDLKKKFLDGVRTGIQREIEWIDERVAGGDRLREEWQSRCNHEQPSDTAEAAS
jgi:hypothetical protein